MKKALTALLLALSLTACATEAKYDAGMQSLVGYPAEELVFAVGAPQNMVRIDERTQIMTYHAYKGESAWIGHSFAFSVPIQCVTNFKVVDGIIVDYSFAGNGCTAL